MKPATSGHFRLVDKPFAAVGAITPIAVFRRVRTVGTQS